MLATAPAQAAMPRDAAAQRDTLLKSLRNAPDEDAARLIETRLHDIWRRAGSPACLMLLDRASREAEAGSPDSAIEDSSAVLVLDPDFAEAFAVRGGARLAAGDSPGALQDAAEALRREPAHLGALMLLSRAAEAHGDLMVAYEAWRKVLEVDPKTPEGESRLNDLHRRAVGEDI